MEEREPTNDFHQLHITIPMSLFNDLRKVLPNRGQITAVTRRLLQNYVKAIKASSIISPLDKIPEELAHRDLQKGIAEGGNSNDT